MAKITSVNLSDEVYNALKHTSNRSEVIDDILRENIHKIGMHTVEDRDALIREKLEAKVKKEFKQMYKKCMKEVVDEVLEGV